MRGKAGALAGGALIGAANGLLGGGGGMIAVPVLRAGGLPARRAHATAIAVMPLEYKLATAALVLLRYGVVFAEIWRITRRLGERGLRGAYFVYDLLSPFYEMLVALLCLRRDDRVWR